MKYFWKAQTVIFILFILQVAIMFIDIWSTAIGLSVGCVEANPLFAWFFAVFGIGQSMLIKVGLVLSLFILTELVACYPMHWRYQRVALKAMIVTWVIVDALGLYVVFNNLCLIF